jgi:hypothetical protein
MIRSMEVPHARLPVMTGRPNANTTLRYDWVTLHPPKWGRAYMARVNEHFILNVHRVTPTSPTWEWLVVGFTCPEDKHDHAMVLEAGHAGSMKEAKIYAESRVPDGTLRTGQQRMFAEPPPPDPDGVPF